MLGCLMKNIQKHIVIVSMLLVFLGLTGCAPKTVLVYKQKSLDLNKIGRIAVLPPVDGRRRVQRQEDFARKTKKLQEGIVKRLNRKRYDCEARSDPDSLTYISAAQIPFADGSVIRKIKSDGTRWILIPVVYDIFNYGVTVKRSSAVSYAEISCYLFDKQSGKLVWDGSASGYSINNAVGNLFSKIPKRKK